jgi:hypothetical protein
MVDPATRCAARDRWPVRNPAEMQVLNGRVLLPVGGRTVAGSFDILAGCGLVEQPSNQATHREWTFKAAPRLFRRDAVPGGTMLRAPGGVALPWVAAKFQVGGVIKADQG